MTEEQYCQCKQEWIEALLNLSSVGYNAGYLGEKNERELIFTSDSLKMSLTIKVEPNNIVSFPKKK